MIKYCFHKQYSLYYQEGMELYHHNDGRLYTLFKVYGRGGVASCPDTLLPHIAKFVTIKNATFNDIDFLYNNSVLNMGQVAELKKGLKEIIGSNADRCESGNAILSEENCELFMKDKNSFLRGIFFEDIGRIRFNHNQSVGVLDSFNKFISILDKYFDIKLKTR